MNRDQRNFHTMVRSTQATRVTHPAVVGSVPAVVRAFTALDAPEARLNAARRRQGEALSGLAPQKTALQNLAILAVLPLNGMVHALASEENDLALRARADYSYSDLESLPDLDSANKCSELLALAVDHKAKLLSDFGLTEQQLEDADDLIGEFAALVGTPREGIKRRKNAGEEIETLIPVLREILVNRLDPLVRQFNDPADSDAARARLAFYTDYENARIIIDTPGADGHQTPAPGTPAK